MKNENYKFNFMTIEIIFIIIFTILLITTIALACIGIKNQSQNTNKNSEATIIMTNIIENMNSKTFSEFESYIEEISSIGISKKIEEGTQKIKVTGKELQGKFFGTEIPDGYNIDMEISNNSDTFNIVKNVNIIITYEVNGNEEKLEMQTSLEREKIDECNAPDLTSSYFDSIGISTEYYNIIPIKYSYDLNSYVTTTESDDEWYNYSSKEWARVLVFLKDGHDLKDAFIDENGVVKNTAVYDNYNLDLKNYMYVWIPNFSIKDNESYFRYAASKKAIAVDFLYVDGQYLYLNTVSDEIADVSTKCSFDGIYGVWRKVLDEDDEYYKNFNLTKYAPLNLHI
jgi:hypothetical protein